MKPSITLFIIYGLLAYWVGMFKVWGIGMSLTAGIASILIIGELLTKKN